MVAQKNLQHFDHSFKGELHTSSGPSMVKVFGSCKGAKRPVLVVCKGASMTITEEVGISSKTQAELPYVQVGLFFKFVVFCHLLVFLSFGFV